MTTPDHYRPDIDGLRAIAIGAVLLYHAWPDALRGGFVGVDVFFVISGFLITGILVDEARNQNFSIIRFYVRRARRLFPALLVVLLTVGIAGWAFMLPHEFANLGKHLVAGAAYLSNIVLWREVGYFDPQAEAKPLLHLWSLAVEEQFYVVWPLLVYVAHRYISRFLAIAVALVGFVSFLYCMQVTVTSQPAAFYSPLTRFWELMLGGVLVILSQREPTRIETLLFGARSDDSITTWRRHFWSVGGLALIAAAVVHQYQPGIFPGWIAMVPVLGSGLLLFCGATAVVNRFLLSAPPMVFVGRISYPLYLWHWPLLAIGFLVSGSKLTGLTLLAVVLSAILLAILSERFVERPFRTRVGPAGALQQARILWAALCVAGLAGGLIWLGVVDARSQRAESARQISAVKSDWDAPERYSWKGTLPGRILFIGDSHMQQYMPRVASLLKAPAPHLTVDFITSSGCAPLRGVTRLGTKCAEFADEAFAAASAPDVRRVVLGGSWAGLATRADLYRVGDPERRSIRIFESGNQDIIQRWINELAALRDQGKELVVILASPRDPLIAPELRYDRWRGIAAAVPSSYPRARLARSTEFASEQLRKVAAAAGARTIDPFDTLCSATVCPVVDAAGRPMFTDESHMRASFVRDHVTFVDELIR